MRCFRRGSKISRGADNPRKLSTGWGHAERVIHRVGMVLSIWDGRRHAGAMSAELSREYLRLIDRQDGVLAIGQAIDVGMTAEWVRNQVRYGRWQVMHRGVYAGF